MEHLRTLQSRVRLVNDCPVAWNQDGSISSTDLLGMINEIFRK
jgi:hypothetical protein